MLAGGAGSRFWPVSTPTRPKQLLPLASDRPLIVDTIERARALANERLTMLDAKIAELEAARKSLRRLARECAATSGGPCPIISSFNS